MRDTFISGEDGGMGERKITRHDPCVVLTGAVGN